MTITDYQTLTGTTVPTADVNRVKAAIARCTARLETLLGYSLSSQKTWTERGRLQSNGYIPFPSLPVSEEVLDNLLAADEATGDLQLFRFDERDTHIKINPARAVYRAKLVLPINEDEFITVSDLDEGMPYLNGAGLVTAISRYDTWFSWTWWGSLTYADRSNLMLAVDAEYIDVGDVKNYSDLAYLLADMVTYYSDLGYSLHGSITSESIDSHSYTRASTGKTPDSMAPEGQASAKQIIAMYAGPSAYRKKVR